MVDDCMEFHLRNMIVKQKEYITFLEETGLQDSIFCSIHGKVDSKEIIDKGEELRAAINELRKWLL